MRLIAYVNIQGQKTFLSLKATDETYCVRYYTGQKIFLSLKATDETYDVRKYPGTENISEPSGQ
jgi:hypothetical protein